MRGPRPAFMRVCPVNNEPDGSKRPIVDGPQIKEDEIDVFPASIRKVLFFFLFS